MPALWDHKSDRDLLLTIIEEGSLSNINWRSISDEMDKKGYGFSNEACRQHFQKLKKESKKSTATSSPAKVTPAKRRATKSASSSFANNSSKGSSFMSGYGNGDDDEEVGRGSKRPKKEENGGVYGQSATLFKMERGATFIDLENDNLYDDA